MLEVNAPMLQEISVSRAAKACIVAPKLEAVLNGAARSINPGLHEFPVAGRHLNWLSIMHSSFLGILISSTRLMERYDTVKELAVFLGLHQTSGNLFLYKISERYVWRPCKRFYNFVEGSQAELHEKLDNFGHNLVKTPVLACIEAIASLRL
jgi:hypothetical protein